jgi:hypothetical protein
MKTFILYPFVVVQALTLLEYLVAHGSERVIDDIKEHSYQISVYHLTLQAVTVS